MHGKDIHPNQITCETTNPLVLYKNAMSQTIDCNINVL